MDYLPRIVDRELDELLPQLPAVALEGPKGVGKTATASRRAGRVLAVDDPAIRALLAADPARVLDGNGAVLIDEWQRLPQLWDLVRRAVDAGAAAGSFLLTGSATPPAAPTHSGAGRIVPVRLRPLSLAERRLDAETVSLAALLAGGRPDVGGSAAMTLQDYIEEIVSSGLPGIRPLSGRARRAQLDGYLSRIVERDFAEQGAPVRRPQTLRGWLRAYAAATSTTTSYNSILDAATPGESEKPAKTTTIVYRDVLAQLWLLDPVPGWTPSTSPISRLAQAPKHHLADPALSARLLGLDADAFHPSSVGQSSRFSASMLGPLFESLVTCSVKVYAQAAEATVAHLRTRNGDHEVDLIVERSDGSVLAIEVKLGATPEDADLRHLHWLDERLGDRLLDKVVVTTGAEAYRRADGVAVVPAALLGP